MEPSISVEEFRRFQTQLLQLREAQLLSNDKRLRAEARIKELEEELAKERASNRGRGSSSWKADSTQLEDLLKENKALRDKLQNTECSFQLQTSTLQAECHHLVSELSQLQEKLNQSCVDQDCQTIPEPVEQSSVQTDGHHCEDQMFSRESMAELNELRTALAVSHATQNAYSLALSALESKIAQLEAVIQYEYTTLHGHAEQLKMERTKLETHISHLENSLSTAEEAKTALQSKLESVQHRGRKVNRELRRQLGRLIKNQQYLDNPEQSQLRKSPSFSSSSSLSSFCYPNGHLRSASEVILPKVISSDVSDNTANDTPSGYFPMEDFTALVNRMAEVQEENCTLRRQLQRLQLQVTAGSTQFPPMKQPSSSNETTHSFFLPKFPSFSTSSTPLSADDVTLNRLKRMCEDLITQNIRLSEELESIRREK